MISLVEIWPRSVFKGMSQRLTGLENEKNTSSLYIQVKRMEDSYEKDY